MGRLAIGVGVLLHFLWGVTVASAAEPPKVPPQAVEVAHLGVATCSGSPCHGAATTVKGPSGVLQNEYLTWQKSDKHAKAYTALTSERGEKIATNLGIGPAEKAKVCLDCHADNVPPEARGVAFHLADGVGCEACHGGAQSWLGPHVGGHIRHDTLVSDFGLYPTERPLERAARCLDCHFGDESRFVSHQIMGAGHPRLAFEVQTFSQIQPAHFVIDDVYRSRKQVAKGVQFWAVGQAVTLERIVTALADHTGNGAFPELVFFDCQACHRDMDHPTWEPRASSGLGPGLPHFNDANAIMLRAIAARVAPDLGLALDADIKALHRALSLGEGKPGDIARRLGTTTHKLAQVLADHPFSPVDTRAMTLALADASRQGDMADYAAAEQATMAFAAMIDTLNTDGSLTPPQYAALKLGLDQCYAATQKETAYDPSKFAAAAQSVARAMPTW